MSTNAIGIPDVGEYDVTAPPLPATNEKVKNNGIMKSEIKIALRLRLNRWSSFRATATASEAKDIHDDPEIPV
ncbi:MAG TPA: hypothetical protein VEH56_06405 [Candidatus Saccharimonadales bacterium]|nr:hypothetical protein [Candidatus Saccharimonadales bacterium]